MVLTNVQKEQIKRLLAECFSGQQEICRVMIFGSFLDSPNPQDLDVAVFQNSDQPYLPLAMKYRRLLRPVSRLIPVDVFPLRSDVVTGGIVTEIGRGQVVYER
jgi:predicted nucleotidyltransferase